MSRTRRTYTAEFKQQAVQMVLHQGLSVAEAARQLGISDNLLRNWKKAYDQQGDDAFPGQGKRTPQEEELYRLRQENRRLRQERGRRDSSGRVDHIVWRCGASF